MEREVAHRGLTELHVVESLHERKALMHELSDGFIALPGGFGTLDELMESVTWAQLGLHAKPIGIVNVAGYFDELLAFVEGGRGGPDSFRPPTARSSPCGTTSTALARGLDVGREPGSPGEVSIDLAREPLRSFGALDPDDRGRAVQHVTVLRVRLDLDRVRLALDDRETGHACRRRCSRSRATAAAASRRPAYRPASSSR